MFEQVGVCVLSVAVNIALCSYNDESDVDESEVDESEVDESVGSAASVAAAILAASTAAAPAVDTAAYMRQ